MSPVLLSIRYYFDSCHTIVGVLLEHSTCCSTTLLLLLFGFVASLLFSFQRVFPYSWARYGMQDRNGRGRELRCDLVMIAAADQPVFSFAYFLCFRWFDDFPNQHSTATSNSRNHNGLQFKFGPRNHMLATANISPSLSSKAGSIQRNSFMCCKKYSCIFQSWNISQWVWGGCYIEKATLKGEDYG